MIRWKFNQPSEPGQLCVFDLYVNELPLNDILLLMEWLMLTRDPTSSFKERTDFIEWYFTNYQEIHAPAEQ